MNIVYIYRYIFIGLVRSIPSCLIGSHFNPSNPTSSFFSSQVKVGWRFSFKFRLVHSHLTSPSTEEKYRWTAPWAAWNLTIWQIGAKVLRKWPTVIWFENNQFNHTHFGLAGQQTSPPCSWMMWWNFLSCQTGAVTVVGVCVCWLDTKIRSPLSFPDNETNYSPIISLSLSVCLSRWNLSVW